MDRRLLDVLLVAGRVSPAIWDAIYPHGPDVGAGSGLEARLNPQPLPPVMILARDSLDWSPLNPQPLPPKEALIRASAQVAQDLARVVVTAEAAGDSDGAKSIVDQAVGNWTGPPLEYGPIPWPYPFPFPWPPGKDPEPHPDWDVTESRVAGALVLAATAVRLKEGSAREALVAGAERLVEAAMSELPPTSSD